MTPYRFLRVFFITSLREGTTYHFSCFFIKFKKGGRGSFPFIKNYVVNFVYSGGLWQHEIGIHTHTHTHTPPPQKPKIGRTDKEDNNTKREKNNNERKQKRKKIRVWACGRLLLVAARDSSNTSCQSWTCSES